MSVQDELRTITLPRQAGPVDPPPETALPPTAPAPARSGLVGRDRPLTRDERQFALGLAAMAVVLCTYVVTFLLIADRVWS